tara:strand:+ start:275 stop:724 length:450 start_codon:yes stop_codon:yes gene_type:complete
MSCLEPQTLFNDILRKINFLLIKDNKLFKFPQQPSEIEEGNREYKINLDYSNTKPSCINKILNKKATQMNFRLCEGVGKAIYFLGVKDNGESKGINLTKLFTSLIYFTKIVLLSNGKYSKILIYKGSDGYIATIRVNKKFEKKHLLLEI